MYVVYFWREEDVYGTRASRHLPQAQGSGHSLPHHTVWLPGSAPLLLKQHHWLSDLHCPQPWLAEVVIHHRSHESAAGKQCPVLPGWPRAFYLGYPIQPGIKSCAGPSSQLLPVSRVTLPPAPSAPPIISISFPVALFPVLKSHLLEIILTLNHSQEFHTACLYLHLLLSFFPSDFNPIYTMYLSLKL